MVHEAPVESVRGHRQGEECLGLNVDSGVRCGLLRAVGRAWYGDHVGL